MAVRDDKLSALCGDKVARVILLTAPGEPVSSDVESALARGAYACLRVHEPLAAFTEVALQDRLESTRSAWGLSAAGITCLVASAGAARGELPLIARAAAQHLAGVAIIEYDAAQSNPWRSVLKATARENSRHPFRRGESLGLIAEEPARDRSSPEAPPLRLVNSADAKHLEPLAPEEFDRRTRMRANENLSTNVSADISDHGEEPAPSVTRDEIAMLLGGGIDDDNGAGGPGRGAAP